jgi:hypothetical protein
VYVPECNEGEERSSRTHGGPDQTGINRESLSLSAFADGAGYSISGSPFVSNLRFYSNLTKNIVHLRLKIFIFAQIIQIDKNDS